MLAKTTKHDVRTAQTSAKRFMSFDPRLKMTAITRQTDAGSKGPIVSFILWGRVLVVADK